MTELELLREQIVACRACPRLVEWRERVGSHKRAAYADQTYWAKPVPGWGDPHARLLIVGLAPAAHGGNRTGRVFTGDRSGDWLFASLYRAGLANQPTSTHRDDGLQLHDCTIAAAVRCAPPGNQPTPAERANCQPFLERELALLPTVRVIVPLGAFAWDATLRVLAALGHSVKPPATLRASGDGYRRPVYSRRLLPPQPAKTPSPASSPPRCSTRCGRGSRSA
jgi:uracil-DNA glycosylase family 4